MSLSITQTPPYISLNQSPVVFVVSESNGTILSGATFQYVAEIYYWTGYPTDKPLTFQYQMTKFKNSSDVGIFDISRILNSLFNEPVYKEDSNVRYYSVDFYTQYWDGSAWIYGTTVSSGNYITMDGYLKYPEDITDPIETINPHFPILSSASKQYFLSGQTETLSIYIGDNGKPYDVVGIKYQTYLNGVSQSIGSLDYHYSSPSGTTEQIVQIPAFPSATDFPLNVYDTLDYSIVAINNSGTTIGTPIYFYNLGCKSKFTNIMIKFKNRYGQYDFFNFNMKHRQTFNVNPQSYSQQQGYYESSTFGYDQYKGTAKNYIIDSYETISVSSDWVDESCINVLKEMMISDEIYWEYDETQRLLKPLTIDSNSIDIKSRENDKLINYSFTFKVGQGLKLQF